MLARGRFSVELSTSVAESSPPNVYVVAGPNGAGKSTFARLFLPEYADCREFVNADLIAAGLSPFNPESLAIEAGRLMLERIATLSRGRVDFGFETTLADGVMFPSCSSCGGRATEFICSSSGFPIRSSPWPGYANESFREGIPFPRRWSAGASLGDW
jgi:hypothetical protein